MNEADRIVGNMYRMAGYHGTTTADVVDDICANHSMIVICYGQVRRMVFTPITAKTIAFKTEMA